jgi:hypothetical protein
MHDDTPATTQHTGQDVDCGTAKRNRFFRGKQMRAGEFQTEQDYFVKRRRLINRSVLGWGVVNGLAVSGPEGEEPCRPSDTRDAPSAATQQAAGSAPSAPLSVTAGLALDRRGREIVLRESIALDAGNTVLLPADEPHRPMPVTGIASGRYLLAIHYAERRVGDAKLPWPCHCGPPEKRFTCETALFSLRPVEQCPCAEASCRRACRCERDPCGCDAGPRSHACLCEWVKPAPPSGKGRLCEWNGYWVDLSAGVDLACVTVEAAADRCKPIAFGSIVDACGPRRLVKGNDLLYDLIRGCDLTRIRSISWSKWHRSPDVVPWADFVHMMGDPPPDPENPAPVTTRLVVTFTSPVLTSTITPDAFALKCIVTHTDTGWYETRSVLLMAPEVAAPEQGDPPDTTRQVTLVVDGGWYQEMTSPRSIFKDDGGTAVIEVDGDYLLDCNRQAIDANARGFALADWGGAAATSSGNGTPGGLFRSVFRFDKRYAQAARRP